MIYDDYSYYKNYLNNLGKYNDYFNNPKPNSPENNSPRAKSLENNYFDNNYLNNNNLDNNLKNDNKALNKEKELVENVDTSRNNSDDTIINIMGIKLAFDDLIILGLLFLLYMENVDDIFLYIVLILLLLS